MPSGVRGLVLDDILQPDRIASQIALQFQNWDMLRQNWLNEKRDLRNYLFATDTTSTQNAILPWKNSTTVPKLTQIRDNLMASPLSLASADSSSPPQ